MSDWLELELAHRLAPVAAPDVLWDRIENARNRPAAPARSFDRPRFALPSAWPVAALASLALIACALFLADTRTPALDLRQLAAGHPAAPVDLHSADPSEIRTWLQRRVGVDVPLHTAAGIRLVGAGVVRQGLRPVAAVAYRVGDDAGTLLVARADPACPLPPHGAHAAAWQSHDQVYALICSSTGRAEAACQLCHSM